MYILQIPRQQGSNNCGFFVLYHIREALTNIDAVIQDLEEAEKAKEESESEDVAFSVGSVEFREPEAKLFRKALTYFLVQFSHGHQENV